MLAYCGHNDLLSRNTRLNRQQLFICLFGCKLNGIRSHSCSHRSSLSASSFAETLWLCMNAHSDTIVFVNATRDNRVKLKNTHYRHVVGTAQQFRIWRPNALTIFRLKIRIELEWRERKKTHTISIQSINLHWLYHGYARSLKLENIITLTST